MFKNISKLIFFFMLMIGSLIAISANSWFSIWMGLEINLLSFIPLMIKSNNLMSSEAALKYFLIQTFASIILLFSVILYIFINNIMFNLFKNEILMMIWLSLLFKMGSAPFHFWFPNVMEGISWFNALILMTWQKIAPMIILSYSIMNNFLMIFIILSSIFGSLSGLNQTSLRKIMAFSSINHMSWMLLTIIFNETLWLFYLLSYFFLSFCLIFIFHINQMFYLNQLFNMVYIPFWFKFFFMINLLSLGGLPPFFGFLPKWFVINMMILNNQYFIILILIFMSLITLFFYLRICYSSFMINYENMNFNYNFFNKNFMMNFTMILSLFSIFGLFYVLIFMFNFF
uniref:NADH-ubiquinone oxidoreductase chain 2 n=1 Tax=Arachnocampa flava TaxID=270899 RepID=G8J8F1_9DIPT|nr:NADH dehydrogenase subunit 2 [Arachnocampa flava]AET13069.1 NADH dehydrogenase subunit 2 [Arachnocampa flava]